MTTETHEAAALAKAGDAFHSALVRGAGYEAALRAGVLAALAQHAAEHRALVADNAALAQHLRSANDPHRLGACDIAGCICGIYDALSSPHPGAALLSEMEGLRKRVAELEDVGNAYKREAERLASERDEARAELAAKTAVALQYETDLRRAESERDEARAHADALALRVGRQETLAEARRITISTMEKEATTARAAALEEAAIAAKRRLYELGLSASLCCEASNRIRALATTPPPPVVPVAKVREVLRKRLSEADTSGERYVLPMVAGDLGINLDGET